MSTLTRDQRRKPSRASGNLRIGDHWNAITIIALSQSNPLKAVAELVENSIDAGAKTIVITRAKEKGRHYLRVQDDGEGVRRNADGTYRMHYDPRLAEPYRKSMPEKDLELWPVYDAVRCPTLVLRGAQSDLLTKETARQMAERGPRARVIEIPGVGHAPTLLHDDQIRVVREFLLS